MGVILEFSGCCCLVRPMDASPIGLRSQMFWGLIFHSKVLKVKVTHVGFNPPQFICCMHANNTCALACVPQEKVFCDHTPHPLSKKLNIENSGSQWQHKRILNSLPPMDTPNTQLPTEQFPLKETQKLAE